MKRRPARCIALALAAGIAIALGTLFWLRTPTPTARPAPSSVEQAVRDDSSLSSVSAERSNDQTPTAQEPVDTRQAVSVADEDTPSGSTATLRILVLDERTEEPLPGMEVMISRQLDEAESAEHMLRLFGVGVSSSGVTVKQSVAPSETTDEHGRSESTAPPDMTLFVSVSDGNHLVEDGELTIEPLHAGEVRDVLVRLRAGGLRFVGKVLERQSKTPLEGVQVLLEESEEPDEPLAHSDEAGFFEVTLDEDQDHWLTLTAPGYGRARCQVVRGHDRRESAQIFRLERSASIVGRVVVPQATKESTFVVTCNALDEELLQPIPIPPLFSKLEEGLTVAGATTDAEGEFELSELPARVNLLLEVFASDGGEFEDDHPLASKTLALRPGEEREVELALSTPVTLSGKVVESDGSPGANQSLWLLRARGAREYRTFTRGIFGDEPEYEATSGEDGSFVLEAVTPGPWYLGPAPPGSDLSILALFANQGNDSSEQEPRPGDLLPIGARIEVAQGPEEQFFVVRLQRGTTIEGLVLDPDSNPAAGAHVRASGSPASVGDSTQARQDGTFVLGPLLDGSYSIEADSNPNWLSSDAVVAPAGATGVVLRVKAAAGSIVGRVIGAEGEEMSVNIRPTARDNWSSGRSADAVGGFEFAGLADEEYEIIVTTDAGQLGYATGLKPSKEGTPVEVSVSPTTSLHLVYEGHEPCVGVSAEQGGVEVSFGILSPRTSTSLQVLPGAVRIHCFEVIDGLDRGKPLATREVQAVAGDEIEVVLN